jgi:hypothetical protein
MMASLIGASTNHNRGGLMPERLFSCEPDVPREKLPSSKYPDASWSISELEGWGKW